MGDHEDDPLESVPAVAEAEANEAVAVNGAVNDKMKKLKSPGKEYEDTLSQSCDSKTTASDNAVTAAAAPSTEERASSTGLALDGNKPPPPYSNWSSERYQNAWHEQFHNDSPQPYPEVIAYHPDDTITCASSVTMNLRDITQGQAIYPSGNHLQNLLETLEDSSTGGGPVADTEPAAPEDSKPASSQASMNQATKILPDSLQSLEQQVLGSLHASSSQQDKDAKDKAYAQPVGGRKASQNADEEGSDAVQSARASLLALQQATSMIKAQDKDQSGEKSAKQDQDIQAALDVVRANLLELEQAALMSSSPSSSSPIVVLKKELTALEGLVTYKAGAALPVARSQRLSPPNSGGNKKSGTASGSTVVASLSLPGAYRQGGVQLEANRIDGSYNGHVDTNEDGMLDEEVGLGANIILSSRPGHATESSGAIQSSGASRIVVPHECLPANNVAPESPDPTGLAMATPVFSQPLQIAQSVSDDGKTHQTSEEFSSLSETSRRWTMRSRRGAISAGVCLLACMIALVIILVLVLQKEAKLDEREALSEREVTALAMRNHLSSVLGKEEFQTSAHAKKAWEWLAFEDPMQLPATAPNVLQRFSTALFYFSTSQQGPWKACDPSDPSTEKNDTCYYYGLLGNGTFNVPRRSLEYERFAEVQATRWLSGAHECSWAGLLCRDAEINAMHLDDMDLNGILPTEISLLSGLNTMSLSRNSFTGHLPSELGTLGNLTYLALEQNRFSGSIPTHLIDTTVGPAARSLLNLDLSANLFSPTTIPTELTRMTNLHYLDLSAVGLVGSIPSEIFHLTRLDWLYLFGNEITGTLPSEVGRLSDLWMLNLRDNQLSGTIPTEVGLLTSLQEISLWANKFTGTIPEELYHGDMSVNALIFGFNNLSGTISSNITRLPSISYLLLSSNPITGTIPTELGLISGLLRFDADFTELSGSIPEELCMLRGDTLLGKLKTDCAAGDPSDNTTDASAAPAVFCPEGCCTKCCNRETKECYKTIYNENY